MAADPTRTPSQHSPEYTTEHHLRTTATKARLVWPLDKRSGPFSAYKEGGPHQLWGYFQVAPPSPWNIRVLANGTVEQREGMTQDEINEAEYVLWGGHEYVLDTDSPLYGTLVAAGYTFTEVT
jgi:hypothetical protein